MLKAILSLKYTILLQCSFVFKVLFVYYNLMNPEAWVFPGLYATALGEIIYVVLLG